MHGYEKIAWTVNSWVIFYRLMPHVQCLLIFCMLLSAIQQVFHSFCELFHFIAIDNNLLFLLSSSPAHSHFFFSSIIILLSRSFHFVYKYIYSHSHTQCTKSAIITTINNKSSAYQLCMQYYLCVRARESRDCKYLRNLLEKENTMLLAECG
jgi:hypothetical protein